MDPKDVNRFAGIHQNAEIPTRFEPHPNKPINNTTIGNQLFSILYKQTNKYKYFNF